MSRVLVVEDDDDIREMLSLLLEDAGHAVASAAHGEEALGLLSQSPHPSVVVLDLMMPVMSGWELRERMMKDPEIAEIPTIVITGDQRWSARPASLHAVASFAKPFDPELLLILIAELEARERSPEARR